MTSTEHSSSSEGLCCTCRFKADCLSYKNSRALGKAILYCEEFKEITRHNLKNRVQSSQKECVDDHQLSAAAQIAKGLCVNCGDADICKLPRFGDNVVFCEEHSSNFEKSMEDRLSHRLFANKPRFTFNE